MIPRRLFSLFMLTLIGLVGCSEEEDFSQPVYQPQKEVTQSLGSDPQDTEAEEDTQSQQDLAFTYNPVGRRDPFKPLVDIVPKVDREVEARPTGRVPPGPLQVYDTKQYRLVGLVAGRNGGFAMVESPDGKTYNFTVGTRIGKREGIVQRITDSVVVVREVIHYESGRTEEIETILSLNKSDE